MQLSQLIDVLSRATDAHVREAQTFEGLADRCHDFLESAFGQKYHEGATDAYRTILTTLRRVAELDESVDAAFAIAAQSPEETPDVDGVSWQQGEIPSGSRLLHPTGPCIA